jgi:hypothetical protein
VNTAETQLGSTDGVSLEVLKHLDAELETALVGMPYLFARPSYGNELTLHFGSERAHVNPKLKGRIRGTHILSVRGSAWLLQSGARPAIIGCGVLPLDPPPGGVKPFNVTALESGAFIGQGAKILHATSVAFEPLSAIGLVIQFDDNSQFMVLPTPPDDDDDDCKGLPEPSDWEVLTPAKVLRVGPGPGYSAEDNR